MTSRSVGERLKACDNKCRGVLLTRAGAEQQNVSSEPLRAAQSHCSVNRPRISDTRGHNTRTENKPGRENGAERRTERLGGSREREREIIK